jgi:predicted Zn-dependent protease
MSDLHPLFRVDRRAFLAICGAAGLAACARVDGTGRSQIMFVSQDQAAKLGNEAFAEIRKQEKESTDPKARAVVDRVAQRLLPTLPPTPHQYEFHVFESEQINAFALPGGKVAVYTGILKVMENEAELAAVVGHELGHIVSRHGEERMSQRMAVGTVSQLTASGLGVAGLSDTTSQLAVAALGAGASVGFLLPYSRQHEYEADRAGTIYMARAGYDPNAAVAFWQRFSAGKAAKSDFFSTHPADEKRIAALQQLITELPADAKPAGGTFSLGRGEAFRFGRG